MRRIDIPMTVPEHEAFKKMAENKGTSQTKLAAMIWNLGVRAMFDAYKKAKEDLGDPVEPVDKEVVSHEIEPSPKL